MRKRIITILLMLTMVLPSVQVFAENAENNTYICSFLEGMRIKLPPDEVDVENTERTITKGEFVYLVVNAMGRNADVEREYLVFPDVKLDSWYHDNLITAATIGLVYGHENGYFGVDDEVAEDTGALIMLRALGFELLPNSPGGGNIIAANSSVYKALLSNVVRDGVITLSDAYQMLYNMLSSSYVTKDFSDKDTYNIERDKKYIQDAFDIRSERGRVTGNEYTRLGIGNGGVGRKQIEIDGVTYKTNIEDTTKYLGYMVDYYVDESDRNNPVVTYIIPTQNNEITEISSKELTSCKIASNTIVLTYDANSGSKHKLNVPIDCDFVYNGKAEGFNTAFIEDLINNKMGYVRVVENDKTLLEVTAYDTVIVDTVSSYDEMIYGRYGEKISIEENGGFLYVEKDGTACSPYDIEKDDVIQIAQSFGGENKRIMICDYILTGAVSRGANEDTVEIDNVEYKLSRYFVNNRLGKANLGIGLKQKFLFNSLGELVDVLKDSEEYGGEYIFLLDTKKMNRRGDETVRFKYVSMEGIIETGDLAEKVRYNGTKVYAEEIVDVVLPKDADGTPKRQLIYVERNKEGLISSVYTADQRDIYGTLNENDYIKKDAVEKKRKCKQQSAWLVDTNDAHFPEFYTDADTKILMVPTSVSDSELFTEASSYEKKKIDFFKDAEDYTVEAYNLDEYNVAGIMLLRQEQEFDTKSSNNSIILVTSVSQTINEDDEVIPVIKGYQSGKQVSIKLKSEDVLTYINKSTPTQIKKFDVVRLNIDNDGYAIHSEYIKNVVSDCEIMDAPEGQNNGNAIAVGKVVAQKDKYLKIKFSDNADVKERVFRGEIKDITIFDGNDCQKGGAKDLTVGSLVLIRVYYTTLRDVIVIK